MNILFLAGNSIHNKAWIYEVRDKLRSLFETCLVHEYDHWHSGAETADIDYELGQLKGEIKNLDDYVVFAKSLGSILTLKGIYQGILSPKRCIIAGLPITMIKRDNLSVEEWLKDIKIPLLFVQNDHDPLGHFEQLKDYLAGLDIDAEYELVELPGDSHNYDDLDELKRLTSEFSPRA